MKKLVLAAFVLSVLLISGLARAATLADFTQARYQTPTLLHDVAAEGNKVYATGMLSNPCAGEPSVLMTQEDETTLVVHFTSPTLKANTVCALPVRAFNTMVELPRLAQAAKVQVEPSALYLIKVEGFAFTMQIPGSALLQ